MNSSNWYVTPDDYADYRNTLNVRRTVSEQRDYYNSREHCKHANSTWQEPNKRVMFLEKDNSVIGYKNWEYLSRVLEDIPSLVKEYTPYKIVLQIIDQWSGTGSKETNICVFDYSKLSSADKAFKYHKLSKYKRQKIKEIHQKPFSLPIHQPLLFQETP